METTEIQVDGYEKVMRCRDRGSGLHALIAVHDTTLGPALGGMRMLPYSSEDEALFDVLRLSEGMTYKSACAETGLGGGKSVIIGDPKTLYPDNEQTLEAAQMAAAAGADSLRNAPPSNGPLEPAHPQTATPHRLRPVPVRVSVTEQLVGAR